MNSRVFITALVLMQLVNFRFCASKPKTVSGLNIENQDLGKDEFIARFLPKSYVIFDTIFGDLNKDGLDDCVVIIKGTDKKSIITDEHRGSSLDKNRRGLIILLNKKGSYELAVKNYSCFSSENEDGGVYYAPELLVDIKKGNLYVNFNHGRYGHWGYTFRLQNKSFELIGYDASENIGPLVNRTTSINFLTKKKIDKKNTNEAADSGEEVFKETATKIPASKLIKLSEIKDFDELSF